jgi:hypothetical protein
MLTLMIMFARPLVQIVGGSDYEPAVNSLRILSIAFGLIWLSNLVDHSLIAVGRQRVLFVNACIGLVVNVTANLVLIPVYGQDGAAVATVLTEIAVLLPALVVLSSYLGRLPSFWVAWRPGAGGRRCGDRGALPAPSLVRGSRHHLRGVDAGGGRPPRRLTERDSHAPAPRTRGGRGRSVVEPMKMRVFSQGRASKDGSIATDTLRSVVAVRSRA